MCERTLSGRFSPLDLRSAPAQLTFQHPLTAPLPLTPFFARCAPFSAPLTLRSHALVQKMPTIHQRHRQTDRQTDGRTTYDSNTALALHASRGENRYVADNIELSMPLTSNVGDISRYFRLIDPSLLSCKTFYYIRFVLTIQCL